MGQKGELALIGSLLRPILLQKERMCEISSGEEETSPKRKLHCDAEVVLERGTTREAEEIPTQKAAGRPKFPGGELLPGWEVFHWE